MISPLFPSTTVEFSTYPNDFSLFQSFDLIILENDHSEKSFRLFSMRPQLKELFVLFHKPSHMQTDSDYLFHPRLSVADNICTALKKWFNDASKENGILSFPHRQPHPKWVAIHPTSNDPKRNWKLNQFITLAKRLKKKGFYPIFTLSKTEESLAHVIEQHQIEVRIFDSLIALAEFYTKCQYFIGNDSGPGHLASNLHVPTLTISGNPKHIAKWRPGFSTNYIATLSFPLPNFKGINLAIRDNWWQEFVSTRHVLRCFNRLRKEHV